MAAGKNPFFTIIYTSCLIICASLKEIRLRLGGVDAKRFGGRMYGWMDRRTDECNSICLPLLGGIKINKMKQQ
jgi:hypothetical protein